MGHLITPITLPLPGSYSDYYLRNKSGLLPTFPITSAQTLCCSYYYPDNPDPKIRRITRSIFASTNETGPGGNPATNYGGGALGSIMGWTIMDGGWDYAIDPESPVAGAVSFGACCSTYIDLKVIGELSHYYGGVDRITIKVNGATQYTHESSVTEGNAAMVAFFPPDGELPFDEEDPYNWAGATYPYEESISLPLTGGPCGDIITIEATTVSPPRDPAYIEEHPSEFSYWRQSSWQVGLMDIA